MAQLKKPLASRRITRRPARGGPDWTGAFEIKRHDGTQDFIRTLLRTLPRNRGRVRLLICPYCSIPRRGLYGWEPCGRFTNSVVRSTWGCRKCNLLRYASEGGARLIRSRGTLGLVFGTSQSPRPEPWLPYVFTSTEEAAEAGLSRLILYSHERGSIILRSSSGCITRRRKYEDGCSNRSDSCFWDWNFRKTAP